MFSIRSDVSKTRAMLKLQVLSQILVFVSCKVVKRNLLDFS